MTDVPPRPRSERHDRHYHASLLVYAAVLLAGVAAASRTDERWAQLAIAGACALAFLYPVAVWLRIDRAREGVERYVTAESTSLAFFASLAASASYGLFEQFAGAPRLSMYVAFLFQTLAWSVAWFAVRRRVA
jgi:hypothetical protein